MAKRTLHFARFGIWQSDIDTKVASAGAGQTAFKDHPSALFDQLHAYDFLLYACLQSGQETKAPGASLKPRRLLTSSEGRMNMPGINMSEMIPSYRAEFPTIYDLEMRDWKTSAALVLTPAPGAPPEIQTFTFWARLIAEGISASPKPREPNFRNSWS